MSPASADLPDWRDGPVAVLGCGVSGQGAGALLRSRGAWVNFFDERGGNGVSADFDQRAAEAHDLVVYSPGFPPDHPWLARARAAGARVLGELDFASIYWPGAVVAVTGTNGKTTLTEFLVHALTRAGADAFAAGNVGRPLSRFFEDGCHTGVAVCEVSSFQAESLESLSPQAVLWTNFAEDHLERHGSMERYFAAKWRLVERLRRPCLLVGASVAEWAERLGYDLPGHTVVVDERLAPPPDSVFASGPQRENYAIAWAYWERERHDPAILEAAARDFTLSPHRLQFVAERAGTRCWDDSKATNFAAAEAALASMQGPVLWIAGGKDKGGDLNAFAARVAPRVNAAFLMGETACALGRALSTHGVPTRTFASLEEAVAAAAIEAKPGANILLSPGFASLDQFSGYAERGERFARAVLSLKQDQAEAT